MLLGAPSPSVSPSTSPLVPLEQGWRRAGTHACPSLLLADRRQLNQAALEELSGLCCLPADDGIGAYDVPEGGCLHRDSAVYHDYAELQSFQSELSYDNLWDAEGREPDSPASFYEV